MLADVLAYLRCPLCDGALRGTVELCCPAGHSFDVARQGYVNLLVGPAPAGADTAPMVDARARVLAAGHFAAITDAVAAAVAEAAPPAELVIDAGAGTGHYLAAVLNRSGGAGLALDIAKPAVRRAARAHRRLGAAVCDIWRGLPVADGCADALLNVFAPRNPAEFHRVLRPDGRLVVVTPRPAHLGELVTGLGLLGVDPGKDGRLEASLAGRFRPDGQVLVERTLTVDHGGALGLAMMGPSAFHIGPAELTARLGALPDPVDVTLAVQVRRYRPEPR